MCKTEIFEIELFVYSKIDLALNNQKLNQTKIKLSFQSFAPGALQFSVIQKLYFKQKFFQRAKQGEIECGGDSRDFMEYVEVFSTELFVCLGFMAYQPL